MPGPPLSETEIGSLVRQHIQDGLLPVMLVSALEAGYGTDQRCSVCSHAIARSQVEYEVPGPQSRTFFFHLTCFALWQLECARWVRGRDPNRHAQGLAGKTSDRPG